MPFSEIRRQVREESAQDYARFCETAARFSGRIEREQERRRAKNE